MDRPTGDGPLSGLRVLDITLFMAGPFCTQILGDLGADVVRIEPPGGDVTRGMPPHFVDGESAYYLSLNRNKRSVAVDLKQVDGIALALDLAARADIVVENYRPGVLERLGLGYEDVATVNPRVIWCSISGFGQTGPYRDLPAYDMVVQAMSGGMSITGELDGPPTKAGIAVADLSAGLYATIGVTAALEERHRTGRGRVVDISMLDCQVAMLSYHVVYHLLSGEVPGPQGSRHPSIPTYRTFLAADGVEVVVTANTEPMWRGVCEVVGRPELVADARFATNADRLAHQADLDAILEDAFLRRPADDWVARLRAARVPTAVVNTLDRVVADPQVQEREMVLEVAAGGTPFRVAGDPLKMGARGTAPRRPPALGADVVEVLGDWLRPAEG